jgi:hypothetical protein
MPADDAAHQALRIGVLSIAGIGEPGDEANGGSNHHWFRPGPPIRTPSQIAKRPHAHPRRSRTIRGIVTLDSTPPHKGSDVKPKPVALKNYPLQSE